MLKFQKHHSKVFIFFCSTLSTGIRVFILQKQNLEINSKGHQVNRIILDASVWNTDYTGLARLSSPGLQNKFTTSQSIQFTVYPSHNVRKQTQSVKNI